MKIGSSIGLALLLFPVLLRADAPDWKADVRRLGTPAEAHAALRRLREVKDTRLLPALLEAAPSIGAPLRPSFDKVLRAVAREQSEIVLLDALVDAPEPARDHAITVLADAVADGRTDLLRARLLGDDAGRLGSLLAATGNLAAPDLLIEALGTAIGEPRRMVVRSMGGLSGFADRVVPVLLEVRKTAEAEDLEAVLAAAHDLVCARTRSWLVTEALGDGLDTLNRFFDPVRRMDVLLALVDRLPDSRAALVALTELDGGEDPDQWRRLLRKLAAKSGEGPSVGLAPKGEEEPDDEDDPGWKDRPRFYGIPIPENDFVLLLDASTSMRKDGRDGTRKIRRVKERVLEVLDSLDGERFNIVFYGTTANRFASRLVAATPDPVRRAKKWVRKIKAGGQTNLELGLREALRDPDVKEIILLSDGYPNEGHVRRSEHVMRLLNGRSVKIHTVSCPTNQVLMKAIAKATGGRATTF